MSEKEMRKLAADDLILEVKNVHLDKRAYCLAGKKNRTSFRSRPMMRRKELLKLVHTDVCFVDRKSHSSGQYFMTFVPYVKNIWNTRLNKYDLCDLHVNKPKPYHHANS